MRLLALRGVVLGSLVFYVVGLASYTDGAATVISSVTVTALLVISAIYSMLVWRRFGSGRRPLPNRVLVAQLLWDGIVILIIVSASGRSTNPFIYYLLVITAISASIFREKTVWMFCLSGIFAYSILMYLDINQHMAHMTAEFRSHLLGMWINFVGSAILISFFISRLTAALQSRERALALAREEILKNEQLIGIGILAASTVHSFGTPLSSIAMATGEIEALHGDRATIDCTAIIKMQIERCKNTMAKLTSLASHKASPYQGTLIETFVAEIQEHFKLMNATPTPVFTFDPTQPKRYLPGGILLLHAIVNLVDNAIHAARTQVHITVESSATLAHILIEDDGSGLKPEILDNLGEAISSSKTGLGIGFLLANSTIERLGGRVHWCNPAEGDDVSLTRIMVDIPLLSNEAHDAQ